LGNSVASQNLNKLFYVEIPNSDGYSIYTCCAFSFLKRYLPFHALFLVGIKMHCATMKGLFHDFAFLSASEFNPLTKKNTLSKKQMH
jgi:hypothetical protein